MLTAALVALPLLTAVLPDPFPAPKTPTAVFALSCRQGECQWRQIRSIERVRGTADEALRKVTSRSGSSTHSVYGKPPSRPPANLAWDAEPAVDYVRCSKRRPATGFRSDGGEWVLTRLKLTDLAGYQYSAANLYLQVCHGIAPGKWTEKQVAKLGYGDAPSGQDRLATEAALLKAME